MKQEILVKLFNGTELTSDEALYVAKHLQEEDNGTVLPINKNGEELFDCVAVTQTDVEVVNSIIIKWEEGHKTRGKEHILDYLALLEDLCKTPKFRRIILINYVQMQQAGSDPLSRLLSSIMRKH